MREDIPEAQAGIDGIAAFAPCGRVVRCLVPVVGIQDGAPATQSSQGVAPGVYGLCATGAAEPANI